MLLKLGKQMQHTVQGFKGNKGNKYQIVKASKFLLVSVYKVTFWKVLSPPPVTSSASDHICIIKTDKGRERGFFLSQSSVAS